MMRRAIFPALLLVAACARSEDASVVADSNDNQEVERVRTPEADDEEIAIGQWRETMQDEQPALEFGPTGAPPLFSLRCDARRSIYLQRHGAAAAGDLPVMLISIGSETRRLAVTGVGGPTPMLRASLAPSDTLVDTLAGATTPITLRVGDAPLVLPADPGIATFLGRCESGEAARGAGNESAGNAAADANENGQAPAPAP